MAIEVFNRYEHKYLLNRKTYENVLEVMDEHMILDAHSENHIPYPIANLYYDTPDNHLIRTSLTKPCYKEKLRLRAYGVPSEKDVAFLEIKKKYNGLVDKRRTKLTLKEACAFVRTGVPPAVKEYMNPQVLKEIAYFLQIYDLQPKVYLAYDRVAYFEKGNDSLRISFDTNIRSRRYDLSLDAGDYGDPLLDDDVYLMEIKTDFAKPLWLTKMLTDFQIKRRSFSKYGTEYTRYIQTAPQKPLKITA